MGGGREGGGREEGKSNTSFFRPTFFDPAGLRSHLPVSSKLTLRSKRKTKISNGSLPAWLSSFLNVL